MIRLFLASLVLGSIPAAAQLITLPPERLIELTSRNPYPRFADGRPNVPASVLEKIRLLSAEEAWIVVSGKGFPNQFEGNWQVLHPGKKLVGRAVTAQFMPLRADVNDVIAQEAKQRGQSGGQNQWVIDRLQPGDVLVVDLFGKVEDGTLVGDNLAAAVLGASGNGFVIDGGIRDLEGIHPMDMAAYFRGAHPSALRNVMLTGFNIPIRIGGSTVMPGDVVLGDREGVYFIPPHLVEEILAKAGDSRIHDEWTIEKFKSGKWKSSELYYTPKDPQLQREFEEYKKKRKNESRGRIGASN